MKHICVLFAFFTLFIGCSPPEPVEIPDPNLAVAVRARLQLDENEAIQEKDLKK